MNRRAILSLLPTLSLLYLGFLHNRCAHAGWPGQEEFEDSPTGSDMHEEAGWPSTSTNSRKTEGPQLSGNSGCSLHGQALNQSDVISILAPDNIIPYPLLQKSKAFHESLGSIYQLKPGISFIRDDNSPNAFATPENLFPSSQDGTILLGLNLFLSEYQKGPMTWEGAAILIHAHEFGHIAEYSFGYTGPVPIMELQADALAGCVMAHQFITESMSAMNMNYILAAQLAYQRTGAFIHASNSVFSMGSYDFNNPNFHGTPQQRLSAFRSGFQYVATSSRPRSIENSMKQTRMFAEQIYT
ncbi:hypothetical protein [Pseudomonas sp. 273]|uniref:hypothetical protein n=1 Tax=Pseudomonas sp. 273 TaxID=75692 RepID=UPI0023D88B34|nr:hypothetical protein [Pseudomonas sp. 273]